MKCCSATACVTHPVGRICRICIPIDKIIPIVHTCKYGSPCAWREACIQYGNGYAAASRRLAPDFPGICGPICASPWPLLQIYIIPPSYLEPKHCCVRAFKEDLFVKFHKPISTFPQKQGNKESIKHAYLRDDALVGTQDKPRAIRFDDMEFSSLYHNSLHRHVHGLPPCKWRRII